MAIQSDNINGFIKYTSRDYESILNEFWALVPKLTDLWKPEADADPGVVLGKYLASVANMLGINLDNLANEVYAPSVTQRKNAEKLFSLIGYTLGWYTAARTEVTFTNNKSESPIYLDFGFNGANFCTLNAYADITGQSRVITYNILPCTNSMGVQDTRSKREIVAGDVNVFSDVDQCELGPGESVTRVAIEGELRNITVSVQEIKDNKYIIKLPSQHLDTTAVWIKSKTSLGIDEFDSTQWRQVSSASEFITPEPRFAVVYDNYSNAQIQVSNYLDNMKDFSDNYLVVFWIECSGVIGSIGKNVLQNFLPAKPGDVYNNVDSDSGDLVISNLANTTEMPHTYTITGKSPETAKEAYFNSRKYINTWDSFITVPDFNRFLLREPGIDCGVVLDCQKALEINLAIYKDNNLTDEQKNKMYITYRDFPESDDQYTTFNWAEVLNLDFDPADPNKFVFATNFRRFTAMCFPIYNDFNQSDYPGETVYNQNIIDKRASAQGGYAFIGYKIPVNVQNNIKYDYRPTGAMSAELQFGYARVFPWYVVGDIYPRNPVSRDVAANIVERVRTALAIYFAPANRSFGQKPNIMEIVEVIENADSRIRYFDAGGLKNPVINWGELNMVGVTEHLDTYDIEYFNPISFAKYQDLGSNIGQPNRSNLRIAPEWIING